MKNMITNLNNNNIDLKNEIIQIKDNWKEYS